ncbi:MAG: hypothetical protein JKY80_02140 [Mariprofundaceae bacterium]|nr:hypothetical protein [Methylophaga sp.]MBL4759640.1 hypothetical protein [Mariprofundaceae bacterium]
MNPKAFLAHTKKMAKSMAAVAKASVDVGLPSDKVGGKVYGDGMTILRVGAIHEFGAGNIPQRSFLRVPFIVNQKSINKAIAKQFESVMNGQKPAIALGRIGAIASNYSKGAFTSMGYGQWQDIKQSTKDAKGSAQPLIDTGILRGSITWAVRNAS